MLRKNNIREWAALDSLMLKRTRTRFIPLTFFFIVFVSQGATANLVVCIENDGQINIEVAHHREWGTNPSSDEACSFRLNCSVSAKFGPLMIFSKRWFAYNKITQRKFSFCKTKNNIKVESVLALMVLRFLLIRFFFWVFDFVVLDVILLLKVVSSQK